MTAYHEIDCSHNIVEGSIHTQNTERTSCQPSPSILLYVPWSRPRCWNGGDEDEEKKVMHVASRTLEGLLLFAVCRHSDYDGMRSASLVIVLNSRRCFGGGCNVFMSLMAIALDSRNSLTETLFAGQLDVVRVPAPTQVLARIVAVSPTPDRVPEAITTRK